MRTGREIGTAWRASSGKLQFFPRLSAMLPLAVCCEPPNWMLGAPPPAEDIWPPLEDPAVIMPA